MDHGDPQRHFPLIPFYNDLKDLATAFTRRGLVKHFWNLNGSERQPSGAAPTDAETEVIPSGIFEPITPSWKGLIPSRRSPRLVCIGRFRFRDTEGQ
jgi:hypothetical protein